MPISLSYHASGIKVEDIASWVGLGWSLNAGGIITRSVNGIPDDNFRFMQKYESSNYQEISKDENRTGWFATDKKIDDNELTLHQQLGWVRNENLDLQPDVFYFNCFNFQGKFVFDKNENIHLISKNDLKIVHNKDNDGTIISFTITDESGNRYFFEKAEKSNIHLVTRKSGHGAVRKYANIYNSSWLLTRVINIYGNKINFDYDEEKIILNRKGSVKRYYKNYNCSTDNPTSHLQKDRTWYKDTIDTQKIKSITWDGGEITFTSDFNRQDVGKNAKALTAIEVYNSKGDLIKGFSLTYSHFLSENPDSPEKKRLKFETIQEYGKNGVKKSPYTFHYNSTSLPDRMGSKQDFWGYYNSTVDDLMPTIYHYPDRY